MQLNRIKLYWALQLFGWSLYVAIAAISNLLSGRALNKNAIIGLSTVFVIGVLISHLYRKLIRNLEWIKLGIWKLIPRILISALLMAFLFELLYFAGSIPLASSFTVNWLNIAQEYIIWVSLMAVWALIYVVFHYFENYRKEEIKNLKWEAQKNEIELNKLKSQLNPHFLFNSMNSIKALINENPTKAKLAVNQLSNILRNSLMMGRRKEISFDEELALVKDYLNLEAVRYEERLKIEYSIHPNSNLFRIPPMMVQTLVENGIKHGIATLPNGGVLKLQTTIENSNLHITITNSGQLNGDLKSSTGFGLKNSEQRLKLLYGENAGFSIENSGKNEVSTKIIIPKT